MPSASNPIITVALTAFNEASYIESAIISILEQDFDLPYEILIGDNCSEDDTQQVVENFLDGLDTDVPIFYYRHDRNLGILENYNFLVRKANGIFFTMAGAHDLLSKGFLNSLHHKLSNRPEAVVAIPDTVWIDQNGHELDRPTSNYDTSRLGVVERFAMSICGNQHALYGMFRLDALRKTRLQLQIIGSGSVLLGELSLLGSFIIVHNAIWYRRTNRQPEDRKARLRRYNKHLFTKQRSKLFQHWKIPWYYFTLILRANVSFRYKVLLMFCIPLVFAVFMHLLWYDIRVFLHLTKT